MKRNLQGQMMHNFEMKKNRITDAVLGLKICVWLWWLYRLTRTACYLSSPFLFFFFLASKRTM